MDDRTIGLVLRALRRRRGWRQVDLADRAGCSQSLVSSVERGHLDGVAIETIRRLFAAVDARVVLEARWRGAELDRLLDADHAAIGRALATRIEAVPGWQVLAEVTYSVGTERGSIDLLAVCPARRAALVVEIKSDIPSAEATGRKLDEKRRLAPIIVRERLGWSPVAVGAVLVLPGTTRLRRLLEGRAAVLARMFPVASRSALPWLRNPVAPFAATWFLSNITPRSAPRIRAPRTARRPRQEGDGARDSRSMERPDDGIGTILS